MTDEQRCFVYGFEAVGPVRPGKYDVEPPDTIYSWDFVELREMHGELVGVWRRELTWEELLEEREGD